MSPSMFRRLLAVSLFGLSAVSAQASIVGSSVGCQFGPAGAWSCSAASAPVTDPGIEFSILLNLQGQFSVDLSDQALVIRYIGIGGLSTGPDEVLILTGLNGVDAVTGFSSTGATGFAASDVSFSNVTHSLVARLGATTWRSGDSATIAFDGGVAVPEPGSLALSGLALVALAARVGRRSSPVPSA